MIRTAPLLLTVALCVACGDSTTSIANQPDAGPGSGGSGGSGGGVDLPKDEVCTNAFDDDGDGKVDCEDSDCKSYTCTASAPDDWAGPFSLVANAGAGGASASGCAEGWTEVGPGILGPLEGPPATCEPCTCGAPNVTCSLPAVQAYSDAVCTTTDGAAVTPIASGTCTPLSATDLQAVTAAKPMLTAASCEPSGGSATIAPATNGGEATLCEAESGGGCKDDGVCAPKPASGGRFCIARAGAHECPGAPYTEKTQFFADVDDTRACAPCKCTPTAVTCSGTTTLFPGAEDCTGASLVVPNDGSCTASAQGPVAGSILFDASFTGGNCNPGGGTPTGAVTGNGEITVCCAP